MDYESRTDVPGYSTPPDFFDEPLSEKEIEERFLDWAYTEALDKPEDYDFVPQFPSEVMKALTEALFEVSQGHDQTARFKFVGDELRDIMYQYWEERVL